MSDAEPEQSAADGGPAALVEGLVELSPEVRACALLAAGGELLAASCEGPWAERCAELLEAADAAAGRSAEQVHVGTEAGEVLAVRGDGLVAVAVSERFALASLILSDLRAVLRDLVIEGEGGRMLPLGGGP